MVGTAVDDAGQPVGLDGPDWFVVAAHDDEIALMRLVELSDAADAVVVTIGVEPPEGDQSCPGNPATPFTVTLAEPLGDRQIRLGNVVGTRPLER